MNIHQLECIVEVANCGSLTQAAQKLFLSQPGLTKLVNRVEKKYNLKIFNRTPRGVELTAEGKDFVYYAKGLIKNANVFKQAMANESYGQKRVLSIATVQLSFLYDIVIDIYEQNKEKNIHFNIVETNRSEVISSVLSHTVNLGISIFSSSDSKSFKMAGTHSAFLDEFLIDRTLPCICVGPQSPFYNHQTMTFDEMRNCVNVVLDIEDSVRDNIYLNVPPEYLFNPNKLVFLNTIEGCKKFLLTTDAAMYVNEWIFGSFKGTAIRMIPIQRDGDDQSSTNELMLLKHKGQPLDVAEKSFCQALFAHFGKQVPEDLM